MDSPFRSSSVQLADRENWFATAIPTEFMGQRVFEPLRRHARDVVRFPDHLPLVLDLMADPGGGVWVRRTTEGTGETWILLRENTQRVTLRFPPGRQLLAVGAAEMAVLAKDDLDVETVEVYTKPRVQRRRA
jgi:hypothetical protein